MTARVSRLSRARKSKAAAFIGALVLGSIVFVAIFGPVLYPQDPWAVAGRPFLSPGQSLDYPLGTDALGRDVLAGVIRGAGISLLIGTLAAAGAMLVGIVLGAVAGYFRGAVDEVLMRLTEVFQTIPIFIFLIVLVAVQGPEVWTITWAIAAVSWPPVARITRAEFLTLREREFVESTVLLGMSDLRIILLEILPNAISPIVVVSSILTANAILNEAALSFLGLGDPNVISWGSMIGSGREFLRSAWFLSAIPGAAILLTVLSISLVGEWINEVMNPKGYR